MMACNFSADGDGLLPEHAVELYRLLGGKKLK
jgi:hypothetical protein